MVLRAILPEHHLALESTDVIKLATGLMATLAALVLGLLISAANTAHMTVENEYRQAMADVVLTDRYLSDYGPETQEARMLLRRGLVQRFQALWPDDDFGSKEPPATPGKSVVEAVEAKVLQLSPKDAAQRWYLDESLQTVSTLAQIRWLLASQEIGPPLPVPFLIVLVSWSTAIFISFGLFTRPNGTVLVSLAISALAVSGAIFLILELGSPFTGLIQVSSTPAHAVLDLLGK